jgi:hypothetical protein
VSFRGQARQVFWRLALEVLGQVHRAAPRSHLWPLVAAEFVLGPLCAVVSGRLGRSRAAVALGALAGSALAVALSLTLFRGGGQPDSLAGLHTCVVTDPTVLSGDGLANLALFAPAAFLAVLAIGRPGGVAAGIAVVSLAVEGLQAIESVGVCDSSDALLNSLGGLAAALAAASVRGAAARRRPLEHDSVPGSGPCHRSC